MENRRRARSHMPENVNIDAVPFVSRQQHRRHIGLACRSRGQGTAPKMTSAFLLGKARESSGRAHCGMEGGGSARTRTWLQPCNAHIISCSNLLRLALPRPGRVHIGGAGRLSFYFCCTPPLPSDLILEWPMGGAPDNKQTRPETLLMLASTITSPMATDLGTDA